MEYYQHNGMAEYHRVRSSSNMSDDDENDVVPTGNTDGAVPCCGCLTTTWIVMMVQQMINTATRRNAQQCRPTSTHPTGGSDAFHTPRRTMSLDDDDDALSPNRRSRSTWGDSSSEVDVSSSRRSRWVVQNGILVHVGKDGVSHAPTNSQTRRVFTHRAPPLFGNAKEREEQAKLRDGQDHALEVLEQKRKPMQSLLELQQFIQDCQEYLPISLKVSAVNGSGFALEIQGPLVATSHPEVLGVVEDVLLEDCEGEHLRLVQIRYADVNFSTPREPSPAQDYASGWLVGDLGDSDDDSPVQRGKSLHECHARLIAFLRNLFDPVNRVAISSMRLSRCMFSPLELRIFLGAHQLTTLEVLVFDRCPLNNAHVESLVQIMREVSLVPGPNELHGSLIPSRGSSPPACSLRLRELQLSGVLTEEGVADLLQCLLSEESACTSLKALRVPNMALNSARQHPLVLNCPALQISANCYESTL